MCACGCKGLCTFNGMMEVFVWSMKALLIGCHPKRRHDGTLFSDSNLIGDKDRAKNALKPMKLRGAVVQVRGDWAWHKTMWGLTGWTPERGEGAMCWKCLANVTSIPFTDFTQTALWRGTLHSHGSFIQHMHAVGKKLYGS